MTSHVVTYDVRAAALACSVSTDVSRRAIRDGDLPTKACAQAKSKPLILAADLVAWVNSWPPSEPRSAR